MSRFITGPLALSLLPVFAVVGALSLGTPRQNAPTADADALVIYQTPSSATDPVHVAQLRCLLHTIQTYDRRAAASGAGRPLHANLAADYRLIVRETTPERILDAGLPLDVR